MSLSVSQKLLEGRDVPATEQYIVEVLDNFYDPEIPVSIWQLGLIYGIDIDEAKKHAKITMTLTTPACPVAGEMPDQIKQQIETLDDIDTAEVELVWEPEWEQEMMSEAAKLELGVF